MIFALPHAVDEAASRAPDSLAMRCLDERLDYAELAARSNQLAHALADAGTGRRDRVGILLDKCIEIPIALHGIMKAGAVYVPLDPAAPAERLAGIVRDCGIRHIVTSAEKRRTVDGIHELAPLECLVGVDSASGGAGNPRCLGWQDVATAPAGAAPSTKVLDSDLAYIIYTSGSTGQPKGIMHTHHSSLSFSRWAAEEYALRPDDVLSNHAPLHFDLSILDFFAGAVAGCATSIIPEDYTKFPASYCKLIATHRITVLYTVPFALVQLLLRGSLESQDLGALRLAIFGGEPFPLNHLRELMKRLPHVSFDNIYGPAEVNGVTHYTVGTIPEDADAIPIGPIAAPAEALVVDEADEPVAPGEAGELLVRTPTMMRGYWNRPDLNARAFYDRTVIEGVDEIFYRTGDLVRETDDGMLWFLGRKDRQVKVRGYRVELDEVEAALGTAGYVEEAAAVALPGIDGSQKIVALITLRPGAAAPAARDIAACARRNLPAYAVPGEIGVREAFPRTTTGKIDRRRLREELIAERDAGSASP